MENKIRAVVLAAGKSTRMKSTRSKVTHQILGKEIINHLLDSLVSCGIAEEDIVVVVGDNRSEVERVVVRRIQYAFQEKQLGTAHALLSAASWVADHPGELLVTVGDNPYLTLEELLRLISYHREKKAACTIISAIFPSTPPPYGRILRTPSGEVVDVVEELEATPEQLAIREVNSSIYLFDNAIAFPLMSRIGNRNTKKEYYLTDIIRILKQENHRVEALPALHHSIAIGINTRWELQEAQKVIGERIMKSMALERGVTILQPESVTIECGVEIGQDTVIYPHVFIGSGTRIGKNCTIGPFVSLRGVKVPDHQTLSFTELLESPIRSRG